MTALPLKLDWFKDSKGYRLLDYGKYGTMIAGNGGKLAPFQPFENNDMVFSAFARVKSPDSLRHFVELYGLLEAPEASVSTVVRFTNAGLQPVDSAPALKGENVASHLETAKLFREVLLQAGRGWARMPSKLANELADALHETAVGEITLVGDRKRGLRMELRATSLLHGLWLQLAQKISGQLTFRTCTLPSCGDLFEVGSRFGRRADARFCSDAHRIEFNSLKRSKRS